MPDTYGWLRTVFLNYHDKLEELNEIDYIKIFVENLQRKCKQVSLRIEVLNSRVIF